MPARKQQNKSLRTLVLNNLGLGSVDTEMLLLQGSDCSCWSQPLVSFFCPTSAWDGSNAAQQHEQYLPLPWHSLSLLFLSQKPFHKQENIFKGCKLSSQCAFSWLFTFEEMGRSFTLVDQMKEAYAGSYVVLCRGSEGWRGESSEAATSLLAEADKEVLFSLALFFFMLCRGPLKPALTSSAW